MVCPSRRPDGTWVTVMLRHGGYTMTRRWRSHDPSWCYVVPSVEAAGRASAQVRAMIAQGMVMTRSARMARAHGCAGADSKSEYHHCGES